jgi:uncharacterized phiE125 gp8 family phage protein
MYGLVVNTAPTVEPLSTTEAKTHCNIDITADDTYIDRLIKAARQYCETRTNRAFINTTFDQVYDSFPHIFRPARSPLVSVSSITYIATDGTSTTLSSAEYVVDIKREPGRIYNAYGYTWPSVRGIQNAVTLRFVAGYGSAGSSVPETIRQAMCLLIEHWYDERGPVVIGTISQDLAFTVDALLASEMILEA